MTFGERLQGEAFLPESVNANKDDRKAAVKVPDRVNDYSVAPEAPVRNFEQQLSGRNSSALR